MEIEILYAIDHDDYNVKVNLLAVPYGETAGEDFIRETLENRLEIFAAGEGSEYHEYEFGWDVVEYRK